MDEPILNREITRMFSDHEKLDAQRFGEGARRMEELRADLLDAERGYLPRIESQTKLTNGHVASLKKWQDRSIGAISVLVTLIIPILAWALYTLVNIDTVVHQAVNQALSSYNVTTQ